MAAMWNICSLTRDTEINPKGLVPAVEYKGKALYESLVLCELLEDAFPSYSPKLLPEDPTEKAYARIWIDYIGKAILPWNISRSLR